MATDLEPAREIARIISDSINQIAPAVAQIVMWQLAASAALASGIDQLVRLWSQKERGFRYYALVVSFAITGVVLFTRWWFH